jgi:hypothetical protein
MGGKTRWVIVGVIPFLIALVVSGVGGCNIHELGHLVTGSALGVPVDDITWCVPANGRIAFAYQEPAFVGYSGGGLAALALGGVYWWLIRPRLDSVHWWAAGVAVGGTAISQMIVAVLEGSSPERYADLQDNSAGFVAVFAGPLLVVVLAQWLFRRPRWRKRPDDLR